MKDLTAAYKAHSTITAFNYKGTCYSTTPLIAPKGYNARDVSVYSRYDSIPDLLAVQLPVLPIPANRTVL